LKVSPIDFLDSLIATPSPSFHEAKAARLCLSYLQQFAFEKAWIDAAGNVVATNYPHEKGDSPDLLLFGHLDTIPSPMQYKRESDRIYGRGAVDAKSSLAALMTAAGEQQVPYKLMVAGVTEEEAPTSKGAFHLLSYAKPKMAINGEPSNTSGVTIAYKGRMVVECTASGKASHAGMASENPIERTIEYYERLRTFYPIHKNKFENVILNLTYISAGSKDALNVVPEKMDFFIDVRLPPSIPNKEVAETFRKLAPRGVSVKVHESIPGVETDVNHPICRCLVAAIREEGLAPRYLKKSGSADMNIAVQAGIPTVAFGPGDSSLDHTQNEVILLSDYEKAIAIIKRAMEKLKPHF
jgi:LysW-gamma-L-lysine carboxypeptidase